MDEIEKNQLKNDQKNLLRLTCQIYNPGRKTEITL
jgi:hypothetical protein